MVFVEDAPEGIFLTHHSTKRRIAKVDKEIDAIFIRDRLNLSLERPRVLQEVEYWLQIFLNKYDKSDKLDNTSKQTGTILLEMVRGTL